MNDFFKAATGLLIVLSGPSGVGKGTVCSALRKCTDDIVYSVSVTTRKPRANEIDGVHYFFKSREAFERMIEEGAFLEWAEYMGNYYGTPRPFVEEKLRAGRDVLLEIEVQGALKVKQKFPQGVFIFLAPPSMQVLKERIAGRGTETAESMAGRLSIAEREMDLLRQYDYVVVNERVEQACKRILSIIEAERCRVERILRKEDEGR